MAISPPPRQTRPLRILDRLTGARRRVAASLLVSLALTALAACSGEDEPTGPVAETGTAGDLEGVAEYPGLSRNHVEGTVDYPQNPPVGGDHAPVWMNCGAYTEPVEPTMAVHSLEHGAVWVAYDPTLASTDVQGLTALADTNGYVLVSPVEGMDAPVVVTAWGVQLPLEGPADERLADFVTKYAQGPQTPEPGAPCTGGFGGGG